MPVSSAMPLLANAVRTSVPGAFCQLKHWRQSEERDEHIYPNLIVCQCCNPLTKLKNSALVRLTVANSLKCSLRKKEYAFTLARAYSYFKQRLSLAVPAMTRPRVIWRRQISC
jgi:hypothetical protein